MPPAAGAGDSDRAWPTGCGCGGQRCDQIGRQERCIAGGGHQCLARGVCRRPFEAGEDPGQRSGMAFNRIGENRKPDCGKTCRIAIGAQRQRSDLWRQTRNDMAEKRPPAKGEQGLVAAAHAP